MPNTAASSRSSFAFLPGSNVAARFFRALNKVCKLDFIASPLRVSRGKATFQATKLSRDRQDDEELNIASHHAPVPLGSS